MPAIRKRSISIKGHRTSFSLEDVFYDALITIAVQRDMPLAKLIAEIDHENTNLGGLSSALRVYIFNHLKAELDAIKTASQETE